jgi:hypothetical protein
MVRSYFLSHEELLSKYTSQLIEGIESDVRYIYVIRASGQRDGVYKIGRTQNLVKRLRAYRTGRFEDVDVIYKYRTDGVSVSQVSGGL